MDLASKKISILAILAVFLLSLGGTAYAVDNVPPVNLNQTTESPTSPFGAFKLVQCDGPAGANINNDPKYVPCDFRGLMIQIQFLINAAIVIGVLAAMIGFAYAGFLYITGTQENIKKAKSIFPKIFWGFIIMLTAWFIVFQILKWLTPAGSAYMQ